MIVVVDTVGVLIAVNTREPVDTLSRDSCGTVIVDAVKLDTTRSGGIVRAGKVDTKGAELT